MHKIRLFKALFAAYVVGAVLVGILFTWGWIAANEQQDRLAAQHTRLIANERKLCGAVKGAGDFWKSVRDDTLAEISDPETTLATRRAAFKSLDSLNEVISKTDVFCAPVE